MSTIEYQFIVRELAEKNAKDLFKASSILFSFGYNAMYTKKMQESFDYKKAILLGELDKISNWLKENVFKTANRQTPKEWLKTVAGGEVSPKAFLEYLYEKYSKIYRF